jgi:hypothetical protein
MKDKIKNTEIHVLGVYVANSSNDIIRIHTSNSLFLCRLRGKNMLLPRHFRQVLNLTFIGPN